MELRPGINKAVFKYIRSGQNILSIGCGGGILEEAAKKKGNHVYGIDISKEDLKEAKKRIDKVCLVDVNKAKKLPFKKDHFDVIIFADVLEHLNDPAKTLQLAKTYLKEEGYIIASLPNVANWSVRIPLIFGSFNYADSGIKNKDHLWFFTKRTAKDLIRNSGYIIKRVDYNTSLVNITLDFLKGNKRHKEHKNYSSGPDAQNSAEAYSSPKRSLPRRMLKFIIDSFDEAITRLFPGLFAFQFILVAKKRINKKH